MSKVVQDLVEKFVVEFKKKENMDRIQINVIDPIIYHSLKKLYPYILISSVIFVLTFLLVVVTLLLIIRKHFQ